MNCEMSSDYLMKFFDGNLNDIENAQLKQHLKVCKKCNDDFEKMNEILGFLKDGETVEPPCDFEENVMKRVHALELARRKRTERTLFVIYWLATVMLSGLFMLFLLDMRDAILKTMAAAGASPGILNALYSIVKGFYGLIDLVADWMLQASIILTNLYYVVFLAVGLFLVLVRMDPRGGDRTARAGENGTSGK